MGRLPYRIALIRGSRLALLLTIALFFACFGRTVSTFNRSVINDYNLSQADLRRIQFYNSHAIVLTAEEAVRESSVSEDHEITITDATYIDRIVIKRYTPAVVVDVGDYWLEVSFEPGLTVRFFALANGRYVLNASSILYGDTYYDVDCLPNRSENCPPTLKVREDFETETQTRRREVIGMPIE